jgi:hypothetical protein
MIHQLLEQVDTAKVVKELGEINLSRPDFTTLSLDAQRIPEPATIKARPLHRMDAGALL